MKDSISVSILDCNNINSFTNEIIKIKDDILSNKLKIDLLDLMIHFDVMDKKFVKNEGINLETIKLAKSMNFMADVHLMVEEPISDGYIDKAVMLGADSITIHYEIPNFENSLLYLISIRKKLKQEGRIFKRGVAIKPDTSINVLKKYISKIDKVLLMSVEPGIGGQKYIEEVTNKVIFLKNISKDIEIQIDGGINNYTIENPLKEGVNSFVIGSYFTKSNNYLELYNKILMINIIHAIEKLPRKANLKLDSTTLQIVEGGYGQGDILLGIATPDIRKCANTWYKIINNEVLKYFIISKFHDYRRFAIFCIINKVSVLYKNVEKNSKNKKHLKELKNTFKFFEDNIEYVNNWDLTDVSGPNILAYNLLILNDKARKKKILKYINNNNFWVKRIGIVSLLTFARKDDLKFSLEICDLVLYDEFHLFQKATGWVLRELYKKEPNAIVEYLFNKNSCKKLPSILLSYACEKMSIREKEKIRNGNKI